MAYLHCHSCDWSQDDFWDWKWAWKFWRHKALGYNPISSLIDCILTYSKPRYINYDWEFANDYGFKTPKIHSWRMLLFEISRLYQQFTTMEWGTFKAWKKHKLLAICPKCGARNFDID